MKRASGIRKSVPQTINGKLSKWKARSTATQSVDELAERCRLAVEEGRIVREAARIAIVESKELTAMIRSRSNGR